MATTIDTLQIEIQSSSTNASQGIRDLAQSLGELKKSGTFGVAVKNLDKLSNALRNFTDASNATRSVGKLVGALSRLKEVGSVTSIGTSITKLSTSLNSLEKVKVDNVAPQIERIVAAVQPLSTLKGGGLSSMVNAMAKIGIYELLNSRCWQAKTVSRVNHTLCVLVWTEQTNLAINAAESLKALENLQTIVQASCRHMHLDVLVVGYLHLAPLTVSVVIANIESCLVVSKTKLTPFNVFHSKN